MAAFCFACLFSCQCAHPTHNPTVEGPELEPFGGARGSGRGGGGRSPCSWDLTGHKVWARSGPNVRHFSETLLEEVSWEESLQSQIQSECSGAEEGQEGYGLISLCKDWRLKSADVDGLGTARKSLRMLKVLQRRSSVKRRGRLTRVESGALERTPKTSRLVTRPSHSRLVAPFPRPLCPCARAAGEGPP